MITLLWLLSACLSTRHVPIEELQILDHKNTTSFLLYNVMSAPIYPPNFLISAIKDIDMNHHDVVNLTFPLETMVHFCIDFHGIA